MMLKFKDFPYVRLDYKDFSARYEEHVLRLEKAPDVQHAFLELMELDHLEKLFISYATVSEAGNTNNSKDQFYVEEEAFFSSVKPKFEFLQQKKNKVIFSLSYRDQLVELFGEEYFDAASLRVNTVNEKAIPLMEEENSMGQEYTNLTSQLFVEEDGKRYTIPMLARLGAGGDRENRRKYSILTEKAYLSIAPQLDDLYDRMVEKRQEIAESTGFGNYTDYCLSKHGRTGYGRKELKEFSEAVKSYVVPVVSDLFRKQEKLSGHPVMNYDEDEFIPGKGIRIGDDLLGSFRKIFGELSPETKVFFDELSEREFFDLELRENKTMGAYSNYLPVCSMPYIFETYNQTAGAVKTFAHECGHGLHSFLHRGEPVLGMECCSSDLCETHSMSMELFVWKSLSHIVDEEDLSQYKYRQLRASLAFICYGTAVDQYQTQVYDNPSLSPEERLALWKRMEGQFLPWRKYEPGLFLDQGRQWQRQIHIMKWPFYYIDYVLAQVCALQFFVLDLQDHETAWDKYVRLLKDSGRHSFVKTIENAGLRSPLSMETMEATLAVIGDYLQALEKELLP